jgi:formylmethanofuran dehydrogenase subunit E
MGIEEVVKSHARAGARRAPNVSALVACALLAACSYSSPAPRGQYAAHLGLPANPSASAASAAAAPSSLAGPKAAAPSAANQDENALASVTAIHGGAGPWVVAGYRMGQFALKALGLPPGSFDLEVMHYSPREVQYSCIADGAAAATGASLGKLNLSLTEALTADTRTVYRNKVTGQKLTLKATPGFSQRFLSVPRAELAAKARDVLKLRDDEIFEVVRP